MFPYKKIILIISFFILQTNISVAIIPRLKPLIKTSSICNRNLQYRSSQNIHRVFSTKARLKKQSCGNPDHDDGYNFLAMIGSFTVIYLSSKAFVWFGKSIFGSADCLSTYESSRDSK